MKFSRINSHVILKEGPSVKQGRMDDDYDDDDDDYDDEDDDDDDDDDFCVKYLVKQNLCFFPRLVNGDSETGRIYQILEFGFRL